MDLTIAEGYVGGTPTIQSGAKNIDFWPVNKVGGSSDDDANGVVNVRFPTVYGGKPMVSVIPRAGGPIQQMTYTTNASGDFNGVDVTMAATDGSALVDTYVRPQK